MARSPDDASLALLAEELGTTVHVIRRLLARAGIHRSPRKARSARQRRRATDQRLPERVDQLGFASLRAYLADRVTERAWPLARVAGELGIDSGTIRDRLDRYGLRRDRWTPGIELSAAGTTIVGGSSFTPSIASQRGGSAPRWARAGWSGSRR